MVIFLGVLSIGGGLASNVDVLSSKVTKTVIQNAVPVVGKLISDASDSIIGSIRLTKSAVGTIGIIIIFIITSRPNFKVIYTYAYV